MKGPILALCLVLVASTTRADEPPPVPEGGINFFYESPCEDNETGQAGHCYVGVDVEGNTYLTFFQDGELMFIRKVIGDTYEVVWVRATYGGV